MTPEPKTWTIANTLVSVELDDKGRPTHVTNLATGNGVAFVHIDYVMPDVFNPEEHQP